MLIYSGLSGPAHPPKEKYSLTAVIVASCLFSYTVTFQVQHTLPKRKIFSQSYFCCLLSLLVCMYWPSRTSRLSESEIFSQDVIVACSLCSYTVAFQDQHTLPMWNILSSCYCDLLSLLVCMYWPSRTSTPSQSEIFSQAVIVTCSLCSYVCIFLPGPAHSPKVKYSLTAVFLVSSYGVSFQDQRTLPKWNILSKLLLWLAVSSHIQWPFRCSTPSQREIFSDSPYCFFFLWSFLSHPPKEKYSLTAVIVACCPYWYTVAFQVQHTLPKRNILWQLLLFLVPMEFPFTPSQREIFSHSCYCGLFVWSFFSGPVHPPKVKYSLKALILASSLCSYVCIGLSGPAHPHKVKYSLKSCYCVLFIWSFLSGLAHPLKVKYSLKDLIVACPLCSYTVAFQDQHTLPKRNILSQSCYCGLLSLLKHGALSGPAHPPKEKNILSKLFLLLALSARMYVLAF